MYIMVIGAGSIGRRHFDNLIALGARAELVPWREFRPEVLDTADAAVIATATDVRTAPVAAAVDRGLPIYLEKPLAFDPEEVETLLSLAAPVADRSMLGLMMRYHPAFRALAQSDLSDVFHFSFEIGHDVSQWRPNWSFAESYAAKARGGGVLLDLCHEIDMAEALFPGLRLLSVGSQGHADFPGVDFASRIGLLATNGAAGEVSMDYLTPRLHRRATLRGQARMFDFDFAAQEYRVTTSGGPQWRDLPLERNAMFLDLMRDFLALVARRPVSGVEHLPRLDRVGASVRLTAQAWAARRFVGFIEKEMT